VIGAALGSTSGVIAQSGAAGADRLFGDLLPWLGLLVVIVLVGGGIAVWMRRRLMARESSGSVGFTLGDLRDLRARGEISEEEFEKAKAQMIAGLTRDDAVSGTDDDAEAASGVAGPVPPRRGRGPHGEPPSSATERGNR